MNARHYVFSGGSRGIGRVAALELATTGASILIVSRGRERGLATVDELRRAGASRADWLEADLRTTAGVQRAASRILEWQPTLDGLVHSAMDGDLRAGRQVTSEGFDFAHALQFRARALLNLALRDALAASGDGRVVHVAAKPPRGVLPDFHDLQFEKRKWRLFASLMSSQVLGLLHAQASAMHWAKFPVAISLACVGPTRTEVIATQPWWVRALYAVIATSTEVSARNVVRFLTDEHRYPGMATLDAKRFEPSPIAYAPELAERAWQLTEARSP